MKHIRTAVQVFKKDGSAWWNWAVVGTKGHVYGYGAKRTEYEADCAGQVL